MFTAAQILESPRRWFGFRPRPSPTPHELGRRGEDLACRALRDRGYRIVARNVRHRKTEIDVVAFEGSPPMLVFVEVKTRKREGRFPAERAVDWHKRRHILRGARAYCRRTRHRGPCRYDVIVIYDPDAPHPEIRLYRDAFRGSFRDTVRHSRW